VAETYGELLAELLDELAKYEDRAAIFRRNDISRNHFYNVSNPNRESSSGKPYPCPTEWGVQLTRDSENYSWIKTVARDCKCICVTPAELEALKESNPEEALDIFRSILGLVNKKHK
jgi:hypothetical protein